LWQKNDQGQYVQVNIDEYLEDISIQTTPISTATVGSNGWKVCTFRENWKTDYAATGVVDVPVTFQVKTGTDFESSNKTYANYRVVLKAKLLDKDGNQLEGSEVSDYLIYTNARVYTGIVESKTN
jgi:hypothetical protein